MQRAQLFLFSIVSAMLIFQYEPLMFSKGVSSDISIKTLTAVQILIVWHSKISVQKKELR